MLSKSLCLLFIGLVASSPLSEWDSLFHSTPEAPYVPVDDSMLTILKESANYASAAYCHEDKVVNWTCGNRCIGNLNVTTYFQSDETEMAGYIGYNKDTKTIVVSFRGTANDENWLMDLDFLPRSFAYPKAGPDVKVHRGFYETYNSVEDQVREGLAKTLATVGSTSSDYELLVTGHSLGAAVATLGALDIKRIYLNPSNEFAFAPNLQNVVDTNRIRLHNFGSPRVGNPEFAALAHETMTDGDSDYSKICRVTNQNDIVPRVPPMLFGFLHTPQEIWINYDEVTVNCHDIVNGEIVEDPNCNAGQFPMSVAAHDRYWDIEFGRGCE
ncbi:alpha/beta-hydrolase, partial [Basidiobolus meristosporus CBS 931.73]